MTSPNPPGAPQKESKAGDTAGRGRGQDSLLPSFPDHCDPLTVFCPSNVLDLPRERLILVLQEMLLLRGIPDPQLPRHVCGHRGGGGESHGHPGPGPRGARRPAAVGRGRSGRWGLFQVGSIQPLANQSLPPPRGPLLGQCPARVSTRLQGLQTQDIRLQTHLMTVFVSL